MPIVLKSGNLNLLEPSGPVQACNGIALLFLPLFYFARMLGVNMLRDTETVGVATVLALCIKKGNESPMDQTVVQNKTAAHTRKSHDS